jgi:hypothetical protein
MFEILIASGQAALAVFFLCGAYVVIREIFRDSFSGGRKEHTQDGSGHAATEAMKLTE